MSKTESLITLFTGTKVPWNVVLLPLTTWCETSVDVKVCIQRVVHPCLGIYLYKSIHINLDQVSGERLQNQRSSGLNVTVTIIYLFFFKSHQSEIKTSNTVYMYWLKLYVTP